MKKFSYRKICQGQTIMVIVPHEDDEINLAGATIYGARQEGLRVICVFVTNGDWIYPAEVRINEAVQALRVLGVSEKDIIFLGYPDGGPDGKHSVWLQGEKVVHANGRTETYGTASHPDFSMYRRNYHQEYRRSNLIADLQQVILDYRPNCIIATDFDYHPDHRMCSLAFDTVMGKILRQEGNDYFPVVLKGFAYSTAFESYRDFYSSLNLLSSKINKTILWNSMLDTDNPSYEWNRRVRIPVPYHCRTQWLCHNVLFKSLACHISQRVIGRAECIINGDQVFWERRTDNLAIEGKIWVSSGDGEFLHDFCLMDVEKVIPKSPKIKNNIWKPDAGDNKKICRCTFEKAKHIEQIVLYGNIQANSRIWKGKLLFSTGYACEVGTLRAGGKGTMVTFPKQENVKWVQFQILKSEGPEAGLLEWEIFEHERSCIKLFHILLDDNVVYQNYAFHKGHRPKIGLYLYGLSGEVRWYINGMPATLEEINSADLGRCVIRVESSEDNDIYDEINLVPISVIGQLKNKIRKKLDQWMVQLERYREKPAHHRAKNKIIKNNDA